MNDGLTHIRSTILDIEGEVHAHIIGQNRLIRHILIAFFAGGHVLLEGVPGLGKTATIKTIASVLGLEYKRISFTPDLLPTDLTGSEIYRPQTGEFSVRKGPIFTQILLADEINRTPPKVQSALLEAMEERQVTIGEKTFAMNEPFFVLATENPLEQEGTYPLPEAQLDRFMMKLILTYPNKDDEQRILRNHLITHEKIKSLKINAKDILEMRRYIEEHVRIDDSLYAYITRLLAESRNPARNQVAYGVSTRAGIALIRTSRVLALIGGRDYVTADDIKSLTPEIFRHRIGLSYEAIGDGITTDTVIERILESVAVNGK